MNVSKLWTLEMPYFKLIKSTISNNKLTEAIQSHLSSNMMVDHLFSQLLLNPLYIRPVLYHCFPLIPLQITNVHPSLLVLTIKKSLSPDPILKGWVKHRIFRLHRSCLLLYFTHVVQVQLHVNYPIRLHPHYTPPKHKNNIQPQPQPQNKNTQYHKYHIL